MKPFVSYFAPLSICLAWLLGCSSVLGRSYEDELHELQKRIPNEKMRAHLVEWQQREPNNPDPPILLANWLLRRITHLSLDGKEVPAGHYKVEMRGDDMIVRDKDGKEHLFKMEDRVDPDQAKEALKILKATRDRFPHRLDIHLGVAQIANLLNLPDEQFDALKTMTAALHTHAGKLRWEWETPLERPEEVEIMWNLHELALDHYHRQTKQGLAQFFKIAQLMVEEFPRQAVPWNDLSVYYDGIEDWPNRQKVLEKAMAITPEDSVVLFNFGSNSRRLGLTERAAAAFRKVIELNKDEKIVGWAHNELKGMGLEKGDAPAKPEK